MPELPEVETTRRGITPHLEGRRIRAITAQVAKLRQPLDVSALNRLRGHTITRVERRGKHLVLHADQTELALHIHLGMSGALRIVPADSPRKKHDHVTITLENGQELRLHDPRRFGAVVWAPDENSGMAAKLLGGLGMEPLDGTFDAAAFHQRLKKRRAPIKQVLLAGDVVVGVGNIYVSEALFHAGLHPAVPACRVSRPRADRLHAAIRQVLARAVEQGGSTLRDFAAIDGHAGHFQLEAAVYGREGQPCRACGTPIRRIAQGQRSTWFCPACQKR